MPYFVPRNKLREVSNPRFRNSNWENWGLGGFIQGMVMILLGSAISTIEIVRIIYGVTNRGIRKKNDFIKLKN